MALLVNRDAMERSTTYSRQLKEIKRETLERPPTDEREQVLWLIEQTRDLIIKVDIKIAKNEDVENHFRGIEAIFRRFLTPVKDDRESA